VEVLRYPSVQELTKSAAELIQQDCARVLAAGAASYVLGLSGGRTPIHMLETLARLPMPWHSVHLIQVDERVAPDGSPDRNFSQIAEHLLAHVDIPAENVHPMPVNQEDLESACRQYERELQLVTNGSPPNLLQLGLGDDGHTASLAPGDPILNIKERFIWYVEEFNGLSRMSMTYRMIDSAERILWLVAGSTRADMCRRLVASDPTIPAGRVRADNVVVLVDADAASGL
jgi:6-phosphogluconolactonase